MGAERAELSCCVLDYVLDYVLDESGGGVNGMEEVDALKKILILKVTRITKRDIRRALGECISYSR